MLCTLREKTLDLRLLFKRTCFTRHPYAVKKLVSSELAKDLGKNLLYNKHGIIVLNKPQGISFAKNALQNKKDEFEVSIYTLLPYLKKILNCETLLGVKVPEKYASGVSIFCTDERLFKKVDQCFRSMRGRKIPAETFECITVGTPIHEFGEFYGGVTIESSPNGKHKTVKMIQECSKSRVLRGEVKNVKLEHKTLAVSDTASKLTISTTRTKFHAVRAYTTTQLISPILGDHVFGRLVRTVLGKPVLVDAFGPAAFQPKTLPKEILSKLELISKSHIDIPLHLHLSSVQLYDFPSKGHQMEFTAPPPEFYKWTSKKLGLDYSNDTQLLNVYEECKQ